jgi:outer membrane lipoprotein SlyB
VSSLLRSGTILFLALLLAACAAPRGGSVRYYDRSCPTCGTVESIEFVWIEDRPSGGGAVLGAIIGAAVGNQIGSGSGRRAATAAGAIAGAAIGHEAERRSVERRRGYRFTVRLDDGRYAEVVQYENPGLRVGDRAVIRRNELHPLR